MIKVDLNNYNPNPTKPKGWDEMTLSDKIIEFRCVLTTLNVMAKEILKEVEKYENESKPF